MRFLASLSRSPADHSRHRNRRSYRVRYLTSCLIRLRRRLRASGVYRQLSGLRTALIRRAAILLAPIAYAAITASLDTASFVPRPFTAPEMRNAPRGGTDFPIGGQPMVQNDQGKPEATNARAA